MKSPRMEELRRALVERRGTTDVDNMVEWLGLHFEESKNSLVTADSNTMLGKQGEARAFDKLLRQLDKRT